MEKCGHRRSIHTFYGTTIPVGGGGARSRSPLHSPGRSQKTFEEAQAWGKRPRDRPGQATKQATRSFDFITQSA